MSGTSTTLSEVRIERDMFETRRWTSNAGKSEAGAFAPLERRGLYVGPGQRLLIEFHSNILELIVVIAFLKSEIHPINILIRNTVQINRIFLIS